MIKLVIMKHVNGIIVLELVSNNNSTSYSRYSYAMFITAKQVKVNAIVIVEYCEAP